VATPAGDAVLAEEGDEAEFGGFVLEERTAAMMRERWDLLKISATFDPRALYRFWHIGGLGYLKGVWSGTSFKDRRKP